MEGGCHSRPPSSLLSDMDKPTIWLETSAVKSGAELFSKLILSHNLIMCIAIGYGGGRTYSRAQSRG